MLVLTLLAAIRKINVYLRVQILCTFEGSMQNLHSVYDEYEGFESAIASELD